MSNQSSRLSVEQEFQLRQVADQMQELSPAELQDLVLELSRQIMIRDNLYKETLKSGLFMG